MIKRVLEMQKHRNRFPKEIKFKALHLFFNSEKSMKEIANELGVGLSTVYRWREYYIQKFQPKLNKKKLG